MRNIITLISVLALSVAPITFAEERLIELPEEIIHYGNLAPTPVKQSIPEVPLAIRGIEGFVLLQFDISEKGRVSKIKVVQQTNPKMAKYSLSMVRKWRFADQETGVTALQPIIFEEDKRSPTLLASN